MTPQEMGREIKRARLEAGLRTQADLAELVGTDRFQVLRWERGQQVPNRLNQAALLRALPTLDPRAFWIEADVELAQEAVETMRSTLESMLARIERIERSLSEQGVDLPPLERE